MKRRTKIFFAIATSLAAGVATQIAPIKKELTGIARLREPMPNRASCGNPEIFGPAGNDTCRAYSDDTISEGQIVAGVAAGTFAIIAALGSSFVMTNGPSDKPSNRTTARGAGLFGRHRKIRFDPEF